MTNEGHHVVQIAVWAFGGRYKITQVADCAPLVSAEKFDVRPQCRGDRNDPFPCCAGAQRVELPEPLAGKAVPDLTSVPQITVPQR